MTERVKNIKRLISRKSLKSSNVFLIEVFQMGSKIAVEDACAMEHIDSHETLCTMYSLIKHKIT